MRGRIYSDQKCPICKSSFIHNDRKRGLFCPDHPEQQATKRFLVQFGRGVRKRCPTYNKAERLLDGMRYEVDKGTFDSRDYKNNNPLSFENLSRKWLKTKEPPTIKYSSYKSLRGYIDKACNHFGHSNIKTVKFAEFEDFFNLQKDISKKTLHNMRACYSQFLDWVVKREDGHFVKPDLPQVKFVLGTRNIVDKATQTSIIAEVKRIAPNIKIWLGIRWLSIYVKMRPVEMLALREKDIVDGLLVLQPLSTKENKLKIVPLLQEDIDLLQDMPKGFPEQHFFRHGKIKGIHEGSKFGSHYLYDYWKRACKNLRIEGVDMYGGTRHSTVTALSKHFSADEIKEHGTGHDTCKAFERYFQAETKISKVIYQKANEMSKEFETQEDQKVVSLNDYR